MCWPRRKTAAVTGEMHPYAPPAPPAFRAARYGYIIDGSDPNVYRAAGRMLHDTIRFNVSEDVVNAAVKLVLVVRLYTCPYVVVGAGGIGQRIMLR